MSDQDCTQQFRLRLYQNHSRSTNWKSIQIIEQDQGLVEQITIEAKTTFRWFDQYIGTDLNACLAIGKELILRHAFIRIIELSHNMKAIQSHEQLCCHTHSTRKEVLNLVCMSPSCSRAGLLCRICCSSDHAGHDTITTLQLIEELENNRFDQSGRMLAEKTINNAKELRVRCMAHFEDAQKHIVEALARTSENLNSYFNSYEEVVAFQVQQLFGLSQ